MLTLAQIKNSVSDIAVKYPIKKISIFGSYADGSASDNSDIDMLIEFLSPNISLFILSDIKEELESKLNKEVDLIHAPIEADSLIKIDKVVDIYE
ncbi:nucleotidyltransferase domain protein [Oxobacter pfennigii]|uniref:Nucleotidyltransferase domain protein n=1 Tax=Oxobacter pfennigii TaxID=36849 RepID=A0A0P8X310_9CLOT|nr:nucleotidyltransferase domain-containing protein [Oxobacter pfennigii]KPU45170.1 nucleotidyltransferase domain protein [Oxobacter pfennigii]